MKMFQRIMSIMLLITILILTFTTVNLVKFQEQMDILNDQQVTLTLRLEEEIVLRQNAVKELDKVTFDADKALADHQNVMVNYMNNNLVTAEYIKHMYEVFDVRTRDLKEMIKLLQEE